MRTLVFISCLLSFSLNISAQNTVQSSCTGADSLLKKYRKDADRLALRNVYKNNTNYKDSIPLNKNLRSSYLGALMAVYNATAIPARDTVVNLLKIHTAPDPEMNNFNIRAASSNVWMMELQANSSPTSNPALNNLVIKYNLAFTYYQTAVTDKVVFTSDSNLNLLPLTQLFLATPGVVSSDVEKTFNDERNITDNIGTNYIDLFYSFGWGTCFDSCDFRRTWKFRVFDDCSVEYLGSTGTLLNLSLPKNENDRPISIYPNPSNGTLHIQQNNSSKITGLEIIDALGRISTPVPDGNGIDISGYPVGLYILRVQTEEQIHICRFFKN